MSGKRFWIAGLLVLLGLGASQAQGQTYGTDETGAQPTSLIDAASAPFRDLGAGVEEPSAGEKGPALPPLSEWLLYPRSPGCCGPVGQHGPIQTDIFVRTGITFPVGGGLLVHSLRDGWDVELGARALFFDPALQRAWTISLSVSNVFTPGRDNVPTFTLFNIPVKTSAGALQAAQQAAQNAANGTTSSTNTSSANAAAQTQANSTPVTLTVPQINASVASFNQTFVNAAFGREWYVVGCADCGDHWNWRVGADFGGRYGSAKLELNELSHRTDTIGGMFVAGHTDLEIPCRCAIVQAGLRAEYGYTWTDILQSQNPGDFQSFSLLFTLGARF
jgi:hypothetical protein